MNLIGSKVKKSNWFGIELIDFGPFVGFDLGLRVGFWVGKG